MERKDTLDDTWDLFVDCINVTFILPKGATGHEMCYMGFGDVAEYSIKELKKIKTLLDTIIDLKGDTND